MHTGIQGTETPRKLKAITKLLLRNAINNYHVANANELTKRLSNAIAVRDFEVANKINEELMYSISKFKTAEAFKKDIELLKGLL